MTKRKEKRFFNTKKWYHATTLSGAVAILKYGINSRINESKPRDFGSGFYLSPSFEWARDNAKNLIAESVMGEKDLKNEIPVVLVFEFCPAELIKEGFTTLFFETADEAFAKFTMNNWVSPESSKTDTDMVGGPMTVDGQSEAIATLGEDDLIAFFMRDSGDMQLLMHSQRACDKIRISKIIPLLEERS